MWRYSSFRGFAVAGFVLSGMMLLAVIGAFGEGEPWVAWTLLALVIIAAMLAAILSLLGDLGGRILDAIERSRPPSVPGPPPLKARPVEDARRG